jgi:hypothetical protein
MNRIELIKKLKEAGADDTLTEVVDNLLSWYATELMIARNEINSLKGQVNAIGWRLNPDRMGGVYTGDETSNGGWK